ncbi:MAG: ATP-dependent DNA helicase RecQ [Candidatus Eisenbacteria bacterium]|nr:ATP-dependent DNA helicase RecQ [Candidatus Eisenbacteria bacterium]
MTIPRPSILAACPPGSRVHTEEPARSLDDALLRYGLPGFRPGQREAIETLLAERRLLFIAATGGGKSLIYQLPAILLPGTTLVISPLISLMLDQVAALERRGIASTFIASSLPTEELRRRLREFAAERYRIVFITPERLNSPRFRAAYQMMRRPLVAVDEAHCISEWGHDFRPTYLRIGELLREIPPDRLLACTATATPRVRGEILERLSLPADTRQIVLGFSKPNLALSVRRVRSVKERDRRVGAELRRRLGRPTRRTKLGQGAMIVYAPTRGAVEAEARRLARLGWACRAYHAGLEPDRRVAVQDAFTAGRLNVVVATNAFGMGIDRADVQGVIHLAPPGSIESYYQEVGRGGRGGGLATGLLLLLDSDVAVRRQMIEGSAEPSNPPPPSAARPEAPRPEAPQPAGTTGLSSLETEALARANLERRRALFRDLMHWARSRACRHDALVRYFGEEIDSRLGCGRCDRCRRPWSRIRRAWRWVTARALSR